MSGGVILEAPYTSFIDLARRTHFWLPLNILMRDRYETIRKIDHVTAPLLIVHGQRDMVVPYSMGQAVYARANEPKEFITLPSSGHNDTYNHGLGPAVLGWLETLYQSTITNGD